MVAARPSTGLSRRVSGSRAGPSPPLSVMPWQEPQSWRTRCTSSFCRAASGSPANATVGSKKRAKMKLLADKDNSRHCRIRAAMIFVAPGLVETALPAFIGKHPLGFQAAFGRKDHRMAGPLFMVDPAYAVAGVNLHLRRGEGVVLDIHRHRLGAGRKYNERQDRWRPLQAVPSGKHDRKPGPYCLTAFTSPSAPIPRV